MHVHYPQRFLDAAINKNEESSELNDFSIVSWIPHRHEIQSLCPGDNTGRKHSNYEIFKEKSVDWFILSQVSQIQKSKITQKKFRTFPKITQKSSAAFSLWQKGAFTIVRIPSFDHILKLPIKQKSKFISIISRSNTFPWRKVILSVYDTWQVNATGHDGHVM